MCDKPSFAVASQPYIDETSSQVAAYSAVVCSVLGVLGNGLSFLVLVRHPTLRRHTTTPFLVSLAFSDLVFSGFNLPVMAVRFFHREWILGYATCVLYPFFLYMNIFVSNYSMALISFNRFVGIYLPHRLPDLLSRRKSWLLVLLAWSVSTGLLSLPLTRLWGQFGYVPQTFSCTIVPKEDHSPHTFLIVAGAALPFTVMTMCYGMIFYRVKMTGRETRELMAETEGTNPALVGERSVRYQTLRREQQLQRTLLLICFGYIFCLLPTSLLGLFNPMPPCYNLPAWHVAGYVLFWCSAFINPLIYTFSNAQYRKAHLDYLNKVLCFGWLGRGFGAGSRMQKSSSRWYVKSTQMTDVSGGEERGGEEKRVSSRSSRHSNSPPNDIEAAEAVGDGRRGRDRPEAATLLAAAAATTKTIEVDGHGCS